MSLEPGVLIRFGVPVTYAVIGAVLIGVSLGLLGSGGSILTVPILLALGHADKQAIAESLAIVGCISLFGAIRQGIRGEVDWRAAAFFAIPGTAGAYLGAKLAEFVPGPVQIVALGIIMLAAALMMAFYKIKECHGDEKPSVAVMIAVGLGVGTITGLVGIGGGFLIVPSLVLAGRVPLKRSIGTSLAVIVLNSAVGFFKYNAVLPQLGQSVNWETIGIFAACGVLGTLIGASIGQRINREALRKTFAVFLVLMGVFLIAQKVRAMLSAPAATDHVQPTRKT